MATIGIRITPGESVEDSLGYVSAGDAEAILLRGLDDSADALDVARDAMAWRSGSRRMMAAGIVLAAYDPASCDAEAIVGDGEGLALVERVVVRWHDTGQHRAILCYTHDDAHKLFEAWREELAPVEA